MVETIFSARRVLVVLPVTFGRLLCGKGVLGVCFLVLFGYFSAFGVSLTDRYIEVMCSILEQSFG
jgi:hypothetical protein